MEKWQKQMLADLAAYRQEVERSDGQYTREMGDDPLALKVAHSIYGIHDGYGRYRIQKVFEACRTAEEKMLLAGVYATWPRNCALYYPDRPDGRFLCTHGEGVLAPFEARTGIHAIVRIHSETAASHPLSVVIELTSFDRYRKTAEEDWTEFHQTVKCNVECATVDWGRDVDVQKHGYLVRRFSAAELADSPTKCAKDLYDVLDREVEAKLEAFIQKATKPVLRSIH